MQAGELTRASTSNNALFTPHIPRTAAITSASVSVANSLLRRFESLLNLFFSACATPHPLTAAASATYTAASGDILDPYTTTRDRRLSRIRYPTDRKGCRRVRI